MSDTPKDDEADKRRDEILKRMLKTPPKPHKPKEESPARKPDPKERKAK